MLPLFVQFALNLSNLFLVPWRLLLELYENQSNCTCNKIDYIFIIVSHITRFGHLRWLRSIDYEFAWIHAKSKSKSKWKWKSKANPIGRQFEGKLSFSFSFCTTVLHSPHAACLIPVHIMKLRLLSYSICRLNSARRGWLITHWLCFISNVLLSLQLFLLLQLQLSAVARVCGVFYAAHTCSQAAPAWQLWVAGSTNSHIIYIVIRSVTFVW